MRLRGPYVYGYVHNGGEGQEQGWFVIRDQGAGGKVVHEIRIGRGGAASGWVRCARPSAARCRLSGVEEADLYCQWLVRTLNAGGRERERMLHRLQAQRAGEQRRADE